ncbi:MAG: hypothetical protein FWG13_08360 [Leptospirales bacterium]|nr:hypothetical protein [Leptospirales bacterium]
MNKLIIVVFVASLLLLAGCTTTPVGIAPSITPLDGKIVSADLGPAKGSNRAFSVLGLFMIGRPDIQAAVNDALSSSGGDALLNVQCYEVYHYFFFFSTNTVIVEGNAVKLSAAGRGK